MEVKSSKQSPTDIVEGGSAARRIILTKRPHATRGAFGAMGTYPNCTMWGYRNQLGSPVLKPNGISKG